MDKMSRRNWDKRLGISFRVDWKGVRIMLLCDAFISCIAIYISLITYISEYLLIFSFGHLYKSIELKTRSCTDANKSAEDCPKICFDAPNCDASLGKQIEDLFQSKLDAGVCIDLPAAVSSWVT